VVSRLKDHAVLLAALESVTTPVTLVSVGFTPDPSFPHSVHRPPSTVHRVCWVPFQDAPRPFYDFFDIVVLPTQHEGLSQGLLEAMALGKPVVSTTSGGNPDLIEHGVHGLLVPPRNPRALGAAIQRLLDDAALRERLGQAAQRRARSEFTIERTAAATEAVYREAMARR
jgi:glycosyltransferase involved in cell wall biosynthesis